MPVRYSPSHDDSRRAQPARGLKIKRRRDPSLSRSGLILSSIAFWFLTSAFLAVGVGVLFVWKHRQERAVGEFSASSQLTRERGCGTHRLKGKPEALERLAGGE